MFFFIFLPRHWNVRLKIIMDDLTLTKLPRRRGEEEDSINPIPSIQLHLSGSSSLSNCANYFRHLLMHAFDLSVMWMMTKKKADNHKLRLFILLHYCCQLNKISQTINLSTSLSFETRIKHLFLLLITYR